MVENIRSYHNKKGDDESTPNSDENGGNLATNGVWKDISVTYCGHCDYCKPDGRAIVLQIISKAWSLMVNNVLFKW